MIGRLWLNKCQKCHWRASSLLFMPNGCNVLALFIKWASQAFLTESRLLRMSSIGMRRTSLIECPTWCFPKRSLSWGLFSPMYWRWHLLHSIRNMSFFSVARSGKIWSAYHLNGIFGKGLVKKYRGGGPEHFEMWLENTWPTPSNWSKTEWPTPKWRLKITWPAPL